MSMIGSVGIANRLTAKHVVNELRLLIYQGAGKIASQGRRGCFDGPGDAGIGINSPANGIPKADGEGGAQVEDNR